MVLRYSAPKPPRALEDNLDMATAMMAPALGAHAEPEADRRQENLEAVPAVGFEVDNEEVGKDSGGGTFEEIVGEAAI